MKGLKSPGEYKRNEVFLSSTSDKFATQVYEQSRSLCGGVLKKNPSQSSLLESISQVGAGNQTQRKYTQGNEMQKNSDVFSKNFGKQNVGERKPGVQTFVRNVHVDQANGSIFLSSLGSDIGRRDSLQGTDVCSAAKSKTKDKKIQQLITSNAPKMTRDKQYYVQKLIQCENALRTKDKKLRVLEKSQKELRETFQQTCASQLMYKTQLQCLQKSQNSKIFQISDLQNKVNQLQVTIKQKQSSWLSSKSSLQAQISDLKQKLQSQRLCKSSIQSKLDEQILKVSSLQQIQALYSQSKIVNAQLQSKNAQLSLKLSTIEKQSYTAVSQLQSKHQDYNLKCSSLENKVNTLEKQNKQLLFQYQQYRISKDKQLSTTLQLQKKLQMQVETLTISLNQKLQQVESNTNTNINSINLKASYDHLKFQNIQLKKFVENNQTEQIEIQSILKLRNMELENDIKQIRENATSEKELSMKILGELKVQLNNYKIKSIQWENQNKTIAQELDKVRSSAQTNIKKLEQKLKTKNQRLSEIEDIEDRFNTLTQFTKVQAQQIDKMITNNTNQQQKITELSSTNQSLFTQISQMKPLVRILDKLYQHLQVIDSQYHQPQSHLIYLQIFETINSILNKTYTFWTPLLQPKQSNSIYKDSSLAILSVFNIEQTEGWETKLLETITSLSKSDKELKQIAGKFKEKTKYYETRLHVCKEEDERKTLVISDLKGNIKLTEKALNQASDKLLKCTILLEQSNQKVIVSEARLADAKNQLAGMYQELKAENNAIAERNLSVEYQLRDLLAKHYQGFYDQIVQRSEQDLLRLDVFLIKAFLNTAIEINHKVKQVIPSSPYMEQLLIERDGILAQIRQYYKELVEPQIAQFLVHHKPLNQQRGNRHH